MTLRDIDTVKHHHCIEEITDVLCNRTQNNDRKFFRIMIAYYLATIAGSMRVSVNTKDRGNIPVNIYALALATSGSGKGYSVSVLENEYLKGFKDRFTEETFPVISNQHLYKLASQRSARRGTSDVEELEKLEKEFERAGALAFSFDSGTPAAVKQMRHKLLLADCGAINLAIDEIGSNLIGNTDILNTFLELYDQGFIKQKLTKNTVENQRNEELHGKTPTNMLLFGTPSKLLDGGQTEDHFYSFLETGYARRCLFSFGNRIRAGTTLSPKDVYTNLTTRSNKNSILKWSSHFLKLADPAKFAWELDVEDDVAIELLTYRIKCEEMADALPEHEEIKKSELSHRYFKALKLAGALAFIDEALEIDMDTLYSAIKLVEESGNSFDQIFNREKTYVKLAKYIATTNTELTHADMNEALPFYKSGIGARNEMMSMAIAWGYKNNIIIKKQFNDGIEFFKGETLQRTNLEKIKLSYSDHFAYNYQYEEVSFTDLHLLTQEDNFHWCNHKFRGGHRQEENVIPGFNLVVLDIDGGTPKDTAHELLGEYTFMTYDTKRSSEEDNRFRLILPINYQLELDQEDYKEFINNIIEWLPFPSDEGANQRSRKWLTHKGNYFYNEGELLDALKFIPKTSKNELYKNSIQKLTNLDNLERWFAQRIATGNRNNHLLKYAMALADSGLDFIEVENRLIHFNKQLSNGLTEEEIRNTILVSVARKMSN